MDYPTTRPIMRSIHEFNEFQSHVLSVIRTLKALSRDDPFLVSLDKLISEFWSSTINGRTPTDDQRSRAAFGDISADRLKSKLKPHVREFFTWLHSLQEYFERIPLPPGEYDGWALPAQVRHSDEAIAALTSALNDARGLLLLAPDNPVFKTIVDQLVMMAGWTRTSLNPDRELRSRMQLTHIAAAAIEFHLDRALERTAEMLHHYNQLYITFPREL